MRFLTENTRRWLLGLFVTSLVSVCLSLSVRADDKKELTEKAYQAYMSGDFKMALDLYQLAGAEIPEAPGLEYNKGGAHYQLGDFEQALKTFEKAALTDNDELAAGAHYNSGNTYFQQQDFRGAVEQYKNALQRSPDDAEARRNLEIALRNLKEQQQQEQDEDGEQNKDKQEDQQQDKQQDQQENQDKQDEQNQEQQQKPDSSQSKPQQKPQKNNPNQMSKEDAERLLNALKDEERKHQKNKRMASTNTYNGKDW